MEIKKSENKDHKLSPGSLPVGLRTAVPKKKIGNRERILLSSIELFNQSGVVAITTNHIAHHLGISPGNLYFHFRNKEEIIYELFEMMCQETYDVWKPESPRTRANSAHSTLPASPSELIERSYEVFWKYRFFHREMYHLRRKDPNLAKRWKTHIAKTVRLLQAMYAQWVKDGVMRKIQDAREMQMISDTVLITSSSFLQFFESPEKPATRRSLRTGLEHLLLFLLPFHSEEHQATIRSRLSEIRPTTN